MIRIRNISPPGASETGENIYEVGINNHPAIATFTHVRANGLHKCLLAAAKAVKEAEEQRLVCRLLELVGDQP